MRLSMVYVAFSFGFMFAVFFVAEFYQTSEQGSGAAGSEELVFSEANSTVFSRKLLASADNNGAPNLIGRTCSKEDIVISQGQTTPLPNGIPTYTVQILNVRVSGCSISNIHLRCGWFNSARPINPRVFRRLIYNDCLANNGQPLGPRESLSFQYANSFQYPLLVSSVACC